MKMWGIKKKHTYYSYGSWEILLGGDNGLKNYNSAFYNFAEIYMNKENEDTWHCTI